MGRSRPRRVPSETALDLLVRARLQGRAPQPGGRPGTPGMPRPNPAMMPKQNSGQLGGGTRRQAHGAAVHPPAVVVRSAGAPVAAGPVVDRAVHRQSGRGGTRWAWVAPRSAFGRAGGPTRRGRKSRRSSGVKSSTRWRRPRLAAYASSKATARRSGSPDGASLTDLAEKIGADAASLVQCCCSTSGKW